MSTQSPEAAEPASIRIVDEEPTRREIRAVFLGLMVVMALGAIDQSIVATALPRIVSELGGITQLSWVVTAYVLTSTAMTPLYGRLADQYGRKPVLYAAIGTFLFGSALCGAAQSLFALIVFRGIQGLGAGGLLPLAQIIIGDLVAPAERGKRQGAIVAIFAVCNILGPVLGGVITDLLSWHWIFYVNLPIGLVSFLVVARSLRRPHATRERRIDYLGSTLLTGATVSFLLVLALGGTQWPWTSPQVVALSCAAVLLAVLLVRHIGRAPEPVLPRDLFRNKVFVVASTVLALTFVGLGGASLFFPLFFQAVIGVSPSYSGFLTGPLMVGIVISSVFNGRVLLRSGRYKPTQIAGLLVATTSFAVLSWGVATASSLAVIEPAIFATGLGLGLVMPNMTIAVQNALPTAHRGVGTATLAFFRSLGSLIGVTGAGAILSLRLHKTAGLAAGSGADPHALTQGALKTIAGASPGANVALIDTYRHAIAAVFATGTSIIAIAFIVIFLLPELPLSKERGAKAA